MTPQEIEALPYRPCVGIVLINAEGRIFAGQRLDRGAGLRPRLRREDMAGDRRGAPAYAASLIAYAERNAA